MTIEAQTLQVDCINSTSQTFTFSDGFNIVGYLIGLSGFSLSYKSGQDHDIWKLSISLGVQSRPAPNEIDVTWTVQLKDKSGNSANSGTLNITVLACDNESLSLLSYSQVPNAASSDQNPPVSSYGVLESQVALQGFNLSMGNTDQRVSSIHLGVCASTSTPSIMAGGVALMTYNLNFGSPTTIDVGVIACADPTLANDINLGVSPLRLTEKWTSKPNNVTSAVQSIPLTYQNYTYFMTGYYVIYPPGQKHHVATVAGSVTVTPTPDGSNLDVSGAAIMNDAGNDCNHQTDASYVDAVVIQWNNP